MKHCDSCCNGADLKIGEKCNDCGRNGLTYPYTSPILDDLHESVKDYTDNFNDYANDP